MGLGWHPIYEMEHNPFMFETTNQVYTGLAPSRDIPPDRLKRKFTKTCVNSCVCSFRTIVSRPTILVRQQAGVFHRVNPWQKNIKGQHFEGLNMFKPCWINRETHGPNFWHMNGFEENCHVVMRFYISHMTSTRHWSMGDLQDPIYGGTLVPYFWPYFGGIFPEI